jgi:hypothetical protein
VQTFETFESVEKGNIKLFRGAKNNHTSDCESKSLDFINDCLKASANPVCLCSFGKDSLVLLHLISRIKKIPVIYWREPFFQKKFFHPQVVAQEWNLEVYDYPPSHCDYLQLGDYFDVYNFYYINGKDWLNLYTGCVDYQEDKPFLCAIKDLLLRPKISSYEFKWDCVFHGHKQVDPVYIADRIELPRLKIFGNGLLSLPIKDWSNEDIWDYIIKYKLPYSKERYDKKDEASNNDIVRTCHNCLDCRVKEPFCPLAKKVVQSVAKSEVENLKFRDYVLGKLYK